MTGIGRYTLNLLQHIGGSLSPDSMVVFAMRGQTPTDGVRAQRVVSPIPSGHELPRLFWEQALVPFDVRRLGIDVYHSPNHVLPLAMHCKSVVTVHDLAFLDSRLFNTRRFLYLNMLTRPSIRKADRIICISQYTKHELEQKFPWVRGKTRLVYQGLDGRFGEPPTAEAVTEFKVRRGLDRYVLFVGALEPRKNLTRLIKAFGKAVQEAKLSHDLILCGPKGWRNRSIIEAWQASPVRERIHFASYVPDEEIPLWYAGAAALAYPSLSEGFGLPALEAMACGTPVVTSNCSALPEVVGDAAITVSPTSVRAISDALVRVLTDDALARMLSKAGLEQSRRFNWETAAAETVAIYREAASA
jgi:glycosyltransferase involved in cell wall biosynthesis